MVSCIEIDGFLGWFWPDAAEKRREEEVRPGSKKD